MKKVNVYPFVNAGQYRNVPVGETVGWVVDEGKINNRRKRTTFKTEGEARAYAYRIDVAREAKAVNAVSDLGELMSLRSELMFCHEKLKAMGATFTQAVDYFSTNYKSSKGDITVGNAMELFIKSKMEQGCGARYETSLRDKQYPRFLLDFPRTTIINKITAEELRNHFYHPRWAKKWGSVTRTNYIKNISALFSFLVKREYLTENRVLKTDKPKFKPLTVGYLGCESVRNLLNTAAEYKWFDRITINVLVLFCGIRVEEASKMRWCNISDDFSRVTVGADIAKIGQRRINMIPDNAKEWLRLCWPKNQERHIHFIIDGGWEDKMSLLRSKTKKAHPFFKYDNNAARHSFGTYHFAYENNPTLTAVMLGHTNIKTLYKHYRNVVNKEDAAEYFNIAPTDETLELIKQPFHVKQNAMRFKKKQQTK